MKIVVYTEEGPVVIYGAEKVDIQTKNGLSGDPIPDEEWTQGFRFKEERDVQM